MAFKLGSETREFKGPDNTPILKKNLEPGIKAEANDDGSIFVDSSVDLGSKEGKKVVAHEMQHIKDMESGKAAYGDDWVRWNNTTYPRETRDGKDMVKVDGEWIEVGDESLAWEKSAIKAEQYV